MSRQSDSHRAARQQVGPAWWVWIALSAVACSGESPAPSSGVSGNGSGGTGCSALTACCARLSGAEASACTASLNQSAVTDAECSAELTTLQSDGLCGSGGSSSDGGGGVTTGPGSGTGNASTAAACTTLSACCLTLPAMEVPTECTYVATNSTNAACSQSLASYQAAGYCGGGSMFNLGAQTCASPQSLSLTYSPTYSAVIPGSSGVTFQVPVVVMGASGSVAWSTSDSSAVGVAPGSSISEEVLTMLGTASHPGSPVTVTAVSGSLCGSTVVNITTATASQWTAGETLFNSSAGGSASSCNGCHGAVAVAGAPYTHVAITPQQLGGFSDSEVVAIIQDATVPSGGYFDPTIVPLAAFEAFHKYPLTTEEQASIVVYLRSLTPAPQTGSASLGGS